MYRAWDTLAKKMLYSHNEFIVSPRWGACIIENGKIVKAKHLILLDYIQAKDINGNKLYVGDIITDDIISFEIVKGVLNSSVHGKYYGFGYRLYPQFNGSKQKKIIYLLDDSCKKLRKIGDIYSGLIDN